MIVVDTNIITYFLIRGERSDSVDRLMKSEPDWCAPRLWLDEFLNVLTTYERNDLIATDDTYQLLEDAVELMDGRSYEISPERVLAVARRTGCSAYDSQYVALAEDTGSKLYTCDKGVLNKCPDIACKPE